MKKQYTTEEIINRLKAGESVIFRNADTKMNLSTSYNDGSHIFFVATSCYELRYFNTTFMFTSDYEKMKSEENENIEDDFTDVTIPFGKKKETHKIEGLGSTTLINPPKDDIPEWLQRERVAHWSRVFATHASLGKKEDVCINWANSGVEQFDNRFLNNSND